MGTVSIPRCPVVLDGVNYTDFVSHMRIHMRGLCLWGVLSGDVTCPPCPTPPTEPTPVALPTTADKAAAEAARLIDDEAASAYQEALDSYKDRRPPTLSGTMTMLGLPLSSSPVSNLSSLLRLWDSLRLSRCGLTFVSATSPLALTEIRAEETRLSGAGLMPLPSMLAARPPATPTAPRFSTLPPPAAATGGGVRPSSGGGRPHCSYCDKVSHIESKYYKKQWHLSRRSCTSTSTGASTSMSASTPLAVSLTEQEIARLRRLLAASGSPSTGSATDSSGTTKPPPTQSDTSPWILDSGASFHMTSYSSTLSFITPLDSPVSVLTADGTSLSVSGRGPLSNSSFHVPSVAYVPRLTMQLLSAGQITDLGCRVILNSDSCCVQNRHTGALVGSGPRCLDSQRLWELDCLHLPSAITVAASLSASAIPSIDSFQQWHHRLDHLCGSRLLSLVRRGLLGFVSGDVSLDCQGSTHEPVSYQDAVTHPEWQHATVEEIAALERSDYKIKTRSDGSLERYKARLVARGFQQEHGRDYDETFVPVAHMTTIRTLLSVAFVRHWSVSQLDVKNVFLNGELREEVYMHPPPGYSIPEGMVCRFRRSLYGLKQAPRAWFEHFSSVDTVAAFSASDHDPALFVHTSSRGRTLLLLYVDDMIITGGDSEYIAFVKAHLSEQFLMSDLGPLRYFIGIEVTSTPDGFFMSQEK
uniref:PH01B035L11.9 protein n=1 Tax=Phyllostachys edulis TaxID=38705 RepID=L0P1P7_PHYED|nr:PH01B035L11.9 [Phyllostachys edulis]